MRACPGLLPNACAACPGLLLNANACAACPGLLPPPEAPGLPPAPGPQTGEKFKTANTGRSFAHRRFDLPLPGRSTPIALREDRLCRVVVVLVTESDQITAATYLSATSTAVRLNLVPRPASVQPKSSGNSSVHSKIPPRPSIRARSASASGGAASASVVLDGSAATTTRPSVSTTGRRSLACKTAAAWMMCPPGSRLLLLRASALLRDGRMAMSLRTSRLPRPRSTWRGQQHRAPCSGV